jgi:hypothetical protein
MDLFRENGEYNKDDKMKEVVRGLRAVFYGGS